MGNFGKRLDGPGGRRAAPRSEALKAVGVLATDRSRVGYLLDVSTTGAKLDGGGDLSVGQDIWLKLGKTDIFATVVWTKPDCCGVHFDAPLDDEDVEELSQTQRGAMYARLTPEEKLGAEDWLNGLIL
jgi:hypothetical protein